jgi:acyl CoA:acetate/3-ketoacid CoA transferase
MRTEAATTVGALLAAAAIAGCGGSSGISDKAHNDYIAGCVNAGQTKAGCQCLYDRLTKKEGVDTESKFKSLGEKVKAATQAANPASAMPPEFRRAVIVCRASLH